MPWIALLLVFGLFLGSVRPAEAFARPSVGRFQEAYSQALLLHARGDTDGAVALLVELQMAAGESLRSARAWDRARQRLHRQLSRKAPDALLPGAFLVERACLAHAVAGNQRGTLAAEAQLLDLAFVFARSSGDRALAAGLLASFGGRLHGRLRETVAAHFYQQALELDPGQAAALVGWAAVLEKRGEPRRSAALLTRAVREDPQHREARLRLALLRGRLGEQEEAMELLAGLIGEGGDDWIVALAYQEQGQLLTGWGQLEQALAVVEEGLDLLPCDPVLPLLWVHYRERLGAPADGLSRRLAECARAPRPSPRSHYNLMPKGIFDILRRDLREAERARLHVLEEALTPRSDR